MTSQCLLCLSFVLEDFEPFYIHILYIEVKRSI